jgi:hypothetical protein
VREAGVIASQAVLIAIGIDWDGRRQVLAVELANRETRSLWPHSSSVIAFTLRVETPCTYISASAATDARSER